MPVAEENVYRNRIFIAFLALLVWVPLPLGSNRPWAWAILEIWVFVLSLLWLWSFYRGRLELSSVFLKSRIALTLLFLWLIATAIQLIPLPVSLVSILSQESARMHQLAGQSDWMNISVDPRASIETWLKSLAYVLVFCLALLLVDSREKLEKLAYSIVYSGLFQAFYGSLMTLSGLEYGFIFKKLHNVGYATGTFVNRDHLAGYLEMCLAMGIGLLVANFLGGGRRRGGRQQLRNFLSLLLSSKMRLRAYLAVMVIALVLTRSRMGNSAFFFSMIAIGIVGLLLSRHAIRSTVILIVSLAVIDTFIVGNWFGVQKVVNMIERTSIVKEADRVSVTSDALQQWKDYFLLGSGGGSFYTVFPRYRAGDIGNFYNHAHNDYIEIASENGVLGVGLLGTLVISSMGAALMALYRRRDSLKRGMAFAASMGMTELMIHSSVDFNLQIPANSVTFMIILSLGWISLFLESD